MGILRDNGKIAGIIWPPTFLAIYNITTPRKKKENLSRMVVRWYVPHASSFQTFLSMLVIYKNNKDILECFFTTKHRFLRKRDVWGLKHKKKESWLHVTSLSHHCKWRHRGIIPEWGLTEGSWVVEFGFAVVLQSWCITDTTVGVYMFLL